jgi:NitT/TauT family transport system substrate-binding protein
LLALFLIVSLSLVACGGDPTATPGSTTRTIAPSVADTPIAGTTVPASGLATVRLGYIPLINYAPIFVAIERGYMAQEGIDLNLTQVQAGTDSVVQLAAGNFDVAAGGAAAGLFNAVDRGVKFKIVAPMHSESAPVISPLVISAKKKDQFKSVADLRGKKIGTNAPGGVSEFFLSQALAKGGLTLDDVVVSPVSVPDMPALLDSGSLDAAILTEPLVTQSEDNGTIAVLSGDYVNGFTSTYVYMGEAFLTAKPALAKGFIKAYLRACRDLQGAYLDDPAIASIIEKYTHVPAAIVARSAHPYFSADGVVPVGDLQSLQDFFLKRGELDYKTPLDVNSFVDTSLASAAAAELK